MGVKKGEKKNEGEKKSDAITVVLKFDMHCEGCAKKVRNSVKKFEGVESVKTECSTNKLMVTGKVDPTKIKEKVEEKTKKTVELVSPQPNKAAKEGGAAAGGGGEKKSDDKKPEEKKKSEAKSDDKKSEAKTDDKKSEDKKEKPKEPPVATIQLKTRVHCEGCAQKIKKIVSKCEGVQDVNVDLKKDVIVAKGNMNVNDLLPYLNLKLKRTVELAPTKKDEGAGGDKKPKEAEKPKDGGGGGSEKPKGAGGEKKEGSVDKKEGGEGKKDASSGSGEASSSKHNATKIEVNRMEYTPFSYDSGYSYAYDPRQQQQHQEGYGHQVVEDWHAPEYSNPPQMFSDENPNACSVM